MIRLKKILGRHARFIKFMLVGFSGTTLDYSILLVLTSTGWSTLFANICSASPGMLNNFYWNKRWTFSEKVDKSFFRQFRQYFLISAIGLGINSLVLVLLENPFKVMSGNASLGLVLAKVTASGVAFVWNYVLNLKWTFKENRMRAAG